MSVRNTQQGGPLAAVCHQLPPFLAAYVPVLAVLAALMLMWALGDVAIRDLTRDPLSVAESRILALETAHGIVVPVEERAVRFYYGLLTNLGVLLWCAAASVCLFTAWLRPAAPRGLFFVCAGALTAILLLDDLFLLHERFLPIYFGLDERWLFGCYGLLLLAYLAAWRRVLLSGPWLVLLVALGGFGMSLALDIVPFRVPQPHFFEDGAKFGGIAGWCVFHVWLARTALVKRELE
jgi:hypothetical protein